MIFDFFACGAGAAITKRLVAKEVCRLSSVVCRLSSGTRPCAAQAREITWLSQMKKMYYPNQT